MEHFIRQPEFSIQLNLGKSKEIDNQDQSESKPGIRLEFQSEDSEKEVLGQFFKFEFYSENPVEEQEKINYQNWFFGTLEPLVILLKENKLLELGSVDRVCFADGNIMGEVIFQIQKEKNLKPGFTGDKGHYVTGGKTISYLKDETGGQVTSSIILNWGLFNEVIKNIYEKETYEDWDYSGQLSFNIFAHEIGHAIDFWIRKRITTDHEVSPDEIDWEKISDYYAPMVFEEYLACVISSSTVTEYLQKDNVENWQNDTDEFIQILLRKRFNFSSNTSETINVFWIILLQLGKILGNQRNKDGFSEIAFLHDEDDDERLIQEQKRIVLSFAETLDNLLDNYPEVPEETEIIERLKPHFLQLAGLYNFYFREEDFPKNEYDDEDEYDN